MYVHILYEAEEENERTCQSRGPSFYSKPVVYPKFGCHQPIFLRLLIVFFFFLPSPFNCFQVAMADMQLGRLFPL